MHASRTFLNALLAAMFLVSLLPAASASEPATPAQETAIGTAYDTQAGSTGTEPDVVPANVPWQVKNELQTLYLTTNELIYSNPGGTQTSQTIAGGATAPGVTVPEDVPELGGTEIFPGIESSPAVFELGETAAEQEITSFSANLFITTTSSATVTAVLVHFDPEAPEDAEEIARVSIPINGVLISAPVVGTPTQYSGAVLLEDAVVVPAGRVVSLVVGASSNNAPSGDLGLVPRGQVNLFYNGDADSRIGLTSDSSRVKAWTEKDAVPGVVQSNFASPANAEAEDRTLKFHYAHVHAMNEDGLAAYPLAFEVIGPGNLVHFESTGSPIGVTAPSNQRWGASSTLPTDTVSEAGVLFKTYKVTYPDTLLPGAYVIRLAPDCPGSVSCPSWTVDVPVNVGASGGTFELADGEDNEKTVLVGANAFATFRLTLTNNGGVADTYALQSAVGSLAPGWGATIAPEQVQLPPGASTPVEVTIRPAGNAATGQQNTATATATSLLSGQSFLLEDTLRVLLTNTRTTGVDILLPAVGPLRVAPGGSVGLPVFVANEGNGFDRMVVSLSGAPAGWTTSATPGLLELGASSQGATILRIEAPLDAAPGFDFDLTMKAARLDNLSESDTAIFDVQVINIDAFAFQAFNGTLLGESTAANPVVHVIRDEGVDASKTSTNACSATVLCWDGTPDADRDYDQSALFRLVLRNDGSRSDTYTLTPYVLTAAGNIAGTLAGESSSSSTTKREALGFRDSPGCDGAAANTRDGINDGWTMRMFEPSATLPGFATARGFDAIRNDLDLTVEVPAGDAKLVYVELKWNPPASNTGCPASSQGASTIAGVRAADPAPGHAVLVEAVSSRDASHRAAHVLNAKLVPAGDREASQRYANQLNAVVLGPESGETLSKQVTAEPGGRTATFDLRAVNAGNEMDTLRITVPQFRCPTAQDVSVCWEQTVGSLDKRVTLANDAGRTNGGTCTTPAVANPSAAIGSRIIAFECTLGAYDEIGFRVSSTAPASGVIGQTNTVALQATSKDSFAGASIFDDLSLGVAIVGQYGLDVVSVATGSEAPIRAGVTTAIPFTVRNVGTEDDNVTIDLSQSLPTGWTGDFSLPNPVFVPAGRQVELLLFAKSPANAATGALQHFQVRATSLDSPSITPPADNVTLKARVLAKTTLLSITGDPQNLLATPGEQKAGAVKVSKATSNPDETVDLTIDTKSVPAGWTASFSPTAIDLVESVAFSAGSAPIYVKPAASALGTSRAAIRVLAHTDGASDTGDADNFTQVGVSLSTPNLGIDVAAPDGLTVLVAPGSAQKTRIVVTNLGVGQDTIRLTTGTMPTGWKAVYASGNVSLQPLESRSVEVTVTSPADLAAGQSRLLTFIGTTSDGVRSDQVQVNFTTGNSVLGLVAKQVGTRNLAPTESISFTVNVNNTGTLPDDIVMRAALKSSFKDVVQLTFTPATFRLEAGKAQDVLVKATLPAGLAPKLDVPIVVEAASKGPFLKSVGATTVNTKVLDYKTRDVDGDKSDELAIDRDLNAANGYEEFRDPSPVNASKAIDASQFLSAAAKTRSTVVVTVNGTSTSVLRFVFDPECPNGGLVGGSSPCGDKKADHLVDRDGDGKPDVYWDPDRGYSHEIPLLKDVTKDGRDDYFFDLDGEAGLRLDVAYDPLEGRVIGLIQVDIDNNGALDYVVDSNGNGKPDKDETVLFGGDDGEVVSITEKANVDGSKTDGKLDVDDDTVIDSDGDGKPDYFIPSGKTAGIPIVLEDVNGDGIDDWTYDSDGDGRRDAYYDPATGESGLIDPKSSFMQQLTKYWYVGAIFGVVLVLFVVLMLVTRK